MSGRNDGMKNPIPPSPITHANALIVNVNVPLSVFWCGEDNVLQ